MELKFAGGARLLLPPCSFNRTFMELKLRCSLISWGACWGFNRTFMELKYLCCEHMPMRQMF